MPPATKAASAPPRFRCSQCGALHAAWIPQCPGCSKWNTVADEAARRAAALSVVQRLGAIPAKADERRPVGIEELDRVLGGGVVPGSVVLLRGEPGAGKSTLLMQAAAAFSRHGPVLYGAGEESPRQVAARARRLGAGGANVHIAGTTDVRALLAAEAELRPALLIVDSVQVYADAAVAGSPGNPAQVAAVCQRVVAFAKATGTAVFAVAHVNADFAVRGGFEIVHLVDASLSIERTPLLRVLRADKNRFGDVDEVGLFAMESGGLVEVPNAAAIWMDERPAGIPGVAVAATLEGSRVLLAEVQALVSPAKFTTPRVEVTGFPSDRADLVLAVLERRAGFAKLAGSDCFISVVGGLRLKDPAADLAVALAVASAATGVALPRDLAAAGEIGLSGQVRKVPRLEDRAREAGRNGLRCLSSAQAPTMIEAVAALGVGPSAA